MNLVPRALSPLSERYIYVIESKYKIIKCARLECGDLKKTGQLFLALFVLLFVWSGHMLVVDVVCCLFLIGITSSMNNVTDKEFDFKFGDNAIFDNIGNIPTKVHRALIGLVKSNEGVLRLVLFDNDSIRINEKSTATPIGDDATNQKRLIICITSKYSRCRYKYTCETNELTTVHSQKPKWLLCDDNSKSVEVILWQAGTVEYDEQKLQNDPIVAVKEAIVLDLGGQLLNCHGNIVISPFKPAMS